MNRKITDMHTDSLNNARKTLTFTQLNTGNINDVFPLLCPVREKDWLDGWEYKMIHSETGLISKDCVFSTPHASGEDTIWLVTRYSTETYNIQMVRWTKDVEVVKIDIRLEPIDFKLTRSIISYHYTALSGEQSDWIEIFLPRFFRENMKWWEKALNHYLETGKMLRKQSGDN